MFGRKKKDLPAGARMMHYEGLRGFSQDGPCFMERTEAGLVFRQTNGPAATLPLEKVTGLEMMPERNFMARYHGTAATTAYSKSLWVFMPGPPHWSVSSSSSSPEMSMRFSAWTMISDTI